jgi:SAM-dependent methyltransferase
MDPQQVVQEDQYTVPYHYLPVITDGLFSQHQYWSWGDRYLGRLQVALDLLAETSFESLIDIGCGDGRFLAEVDARFHQKSLLGIDPSEKAVALARRMNPSLRYESADLSTATWSERWDVATLLEVIEHIPPNTLPDFLVAVVDTLNPGGHVIITAPNLNQNVPPKHYQHFDADVLRDVLPRSLTILRTVPFDAPSLILRFVVKLMGGSGRYYIVTHPRLTSWVLRYYLKRCLHGGGVKRCQRIACVARKGAA